MKEYSNFIIYQPINDIDIYLDNDSDGLNTLLCELIQEFNDTLCVPRAPEQILDRTYYWAKRICLEKHPAISGFKNRLSNTIDMDITMDGKLQFHNDDTFGIIIAYVLLSLQVALPKVTEDFLPNIRTIINYSTVLEMIDLFLQNHPTQKFDTDLRPKINLYTHEGLREATDDFSTQGIKDLLRIYNDKKEQQTALNCIINSYQKLGGEIKEFDLPF